jgi:hypothetical protein
MKSIPNQKIFITSELSFSPRFNLKRPREQNAFLWSLDRGVTEKTKNKVYLTVTLLDNKTWLAEFF